MKKLIISTILAATQMAMAEGTELPNGGSHFEYSCSTTCTFKTSRHNIVVADQAQTISANAGINQIKVCGRGVGGNIEARYTKDADEKGYIVNIRDLNNMSGFENRCQIFESPKPYLNNIYVRGSSARDIQFFISSAVVGANGAHGSGYSVNLPADMKLATHGMVGLLKHSAAQLNSFTSNIKKTDRRHTERLKKALNDALALLVNEKNEALLPVTHISVQENARLIMVLSTVLNELLDDYEGVESVKAQVTSLTNLSKQIRESTAGPEGLAGVSSKSYAALATVIDLELRDLVTTMSAFAAGNASVFYELMKVNHAVIRAVMAKNGGDAAARVQVETFIRTWNAPEWQKVLSSLMNAPADYKGLVQPKLKLLLMAVESMSDKGEFPVSIPMDSKK